MKERLSIVPVDKKDTALELSEAERGRLSHSARVNTRAEIEDEKRKARFGARQHVQNMSALGILQEDPELSPEEEQDIRNTVTRSLERYRTRHKE